MKDNIGNHLGEKGKEFGTVTKRKRRCGWFDSVLLKQSINLNGITDIVLTKLDVLDQLEEIKVCIGYDIEGKKYDYLPSSEFLYEKIKPVYKTIAGWQTSTAGISNFSNLPNKAIDYIKTLEDLMEIKISIVSTGPDRKETIDINGTLLNI